MSKAAIFLLLAASSVQADPQLISGSGLGPVVKRPDGTLAQLGSIPFSVGAAITPPGQPAPVHSTPAMIVATFNVDHQLCQQRKLDENPNDPNPPAPMLCKQATRLYFKLQVRTRPPRGSTGTVVAEKTFTFGRSILYSADAMSADPRQPLPMNTYYKSVVSSQEPLTYHFPVTTPLQSGFYALEAYVYSDVSDTQTHPTVSLSNATVMLLK
jgi:hypothetical protein